MYKCIKGFSLDRCDDDGFTIEGEYEVVEEGSLWHIPEDAEYRLIGGEIRLEDNEGKWIEICNETLKEHFKPMEEYKEVTSDEAKKIIETRKPLGLFWHKENALYVAIDNLTGDAWTEDFKSKKQCFEYLSGSEPIQTFSEC